MGTGQNHLRGTVSMCVKRGKFCLLGGNLLHGKGNPVRPRGIHVKDGTDYNSG